MTAAETADSAAVCKEGVTIQVPCIKYTRQYHMLFPADLLGTRIGSRSIHSLGSRCLRVYKGFVHKEPNEYKFKKLISVRGHDVKRMNVTKI